MHQVRWSMFLLVGLAGVSGARTMTPAQGFFSSLHDHCGKAYAGVIEKNEPADPADPFTGKPLVMQVRECEGTVLRIPFHVGDDHSRTWVVTLVHDLQLQLKHDHRHADGSPDALTMYGGSTSGHGEYNRQEFPADDESKALFQREGRAASVANVWTLEIGREAFVYQLSRPDGRLFRVRFDLRKPVPAPPPPWGADVGSQAGREGQPAGD
jgi:hypothetical protein